jgi:hypothetical protein
MCSAFCPQHTEAVSNLTAWRFGDDDKQFPFDLPQHKAIMCSMSPETEKLNVFRIFNLMMLWLMVFAENFIKQTSESGSFHRLKRFLMGRRVCFSELVLLINW